MLPLKVLAQPVPMSLAQNCNALSSGTVLAALEKPEQEPRGATVTPTMEDACIRTLLNRLVANTPARGRRIGVRLKTLGRVTFQLTE
jgi:hypothetical protein